MTYLSPPFKSPLRNFGAVDKFIDVGRHCCFGPNCGPGSELIMETTFILIYRDFFFLSRLSLSQLFHTYCSVQAALSALTEGETEAQVVLADEPSRGTDVSLKGSLDIGAAVTSFRLRSLLTQ